MPRSLLDNIILELIQCLNIPNIRPYLRQARLLTDDELERLEVTPANTTKDVVEALATFLKRKGPGHERSFLLVLKESMKGDAHQGHAHIIDLLEKQLANAYATENSLLENRMSGVQLHSSPADREDMICSDSPHVSQSSDSPHISQSSDSPHVSRSSDSPRVNRSSLDSQGYHLDQQIVASKLNARAPLKLGELEYIQGKDQREIKALRCKVVRDSQNITMKFASLVLGVYRLLVRLQVPIEEIRMVLRYFGCFKNMHKSENVPMFNSSSDIAKAQDLASLIECLHNYSSWFNYGLIKFVATKFGEDEGEKLVADYEEELTKYYENLIAYACPEFSLTKGVPPGYEHLVVKVDWDYQSCKVQDVALFQASISSILGLEPEVFQLRSIEEGCVLFTWAIPSVVVQHVLLQAQQSKNALQERAVLFVCVAGKCMEVPRTYLEKHCGNSKPEQQTMTKFSRVSVKQMHSNESSNTSCSSLSDVTTVSPSGFQSNRSSQTSTLLDNFPINEAEAEIISIYSGISGDLSSGRSESPVSGKRNFALRQHSAQQHSANQSSAQSKCHCSINQCSSVCNLSFFHSSPTLKENRRAMSVPHLNSVSATKSRVTSKGKRCLPTKLLSKFLRITRKSNDQDRKEVKKPSFQLLQLSEEPKLMGDGRMLHYYVTGLPQQTPDYTIPQSSQTPGCPEDSSSISEMGPVTLPSTSPPTTTVSPSPMIQKIVEESTMYTCRVASPDQASVGSSSGYCSQSDLNVHSLVPCIFQDSIVEQGSDFPNRRHSLHIRSRYATQPLNSAGFPQSRSRSIH